MIPDQLELNCHYFLSAKGARKLGPVFSDVQTYCAFIGYPRSGHTLLASLLDAHPLVLMANELDALKYVKAGFTRDQLYFLMMETSRLFTLYGRRIYKYNYSVPGQWQSRPKKIQVVGDKKGDTTTFALTENPGLLTKLRHLVGVPVKFIHGIRNPFDNITTIHFLNTRQDLRAAVEYFFLLCERNARLKNKLAKRDVLDVRNEDLIASPRAEIIRLCGFLNLPAPGDYLDSCSSIIFKKPHTTRHRIRWPRSMVIEVMRRSEAFPWLKGYES